MYWDSDRDTLLWKQILSWGQATKSDIFGNRLHYRITTTTISMLHNALQIFIVLSLNFGQDLITINR